MLSVVVPGMIRWRGSFLQLGLPPSSAYGIAYSSPHPSQHGVQSTDGYPWNTEAGGHIGVRLGLRSWHSH